MGRPERYIGSNLCNSRGPSSSRIAIASQCYPLIVIIQNAHGATGITVSDACFVAISANSTDLIRLQVTPVSNVASVLNITFKKRLGYFDAGFFLHNGIN